MPARASSSLSSLVSSPLRASSPAVRAFQLPPVMAPVGKTTEPSLVTMRANCLSVRLRRRAVSRSSVITTRPKREARAGRKRASQPMSSRAGPKTPGWLKRALACGENSEPCTVSSGRMVTLPPCTFCSQAMRAFASFSPSVIRFCRPEPRATSKAVSRPSGTWITSATVPRTKGDISELWRMRRTPAA